MISTRVRKGCSTTPAKMATIVNLSGYLEKEFTRSAGGLAPQYVRLGFFVNNATDKKYYALRTSQAFIGLLDVAAPPITYGLRFGIGF